MMRKGRWGHILLENMIDFHKSPAIVTSGPLILDFAMWPTCKSNRVPQQYSLGLPTPAESDFTLDEISTKIVEMGQVYPKPASKRHITPCVEAQKPYQLTLRGQPIKTCHLTNGWEH